jgi:hypothetical protein
LKEKITRHVRDRSLHHLLIAAANCEIAPTNRSRTKKIRAAGIRDGKGVRQGMPLSPFFANLILRNFDQTIQNANISMVRYADDLICLCESNSACRDVHELVGETLLKEGLTVPPVGPESKSQIYGPDEPADFLGLQLRPQNGEYILEISGKQIQEIRKRIISFADFDSLDKQGITFSVFLRRLDGMLAGYSGAYEFAANANHLGLVLDSARSEAVEQLLSKTLGISVKQLPIASKRFLGISNEIS